MSIRTMRWNALLTCAVTLTACEPSSSTAPANLHAEHVAAAMSETGAEHAGLVTAVRAATVRYSSTVQAAKAGYLPDPFCVASPAGGRGHHWVKPPLVDGVFEPTNPEVVLYAPDKHGRLKLVAVEYIVVKPGPTAPAPTFEGHTFDDGGAPLQVPHWTLHVWLYEPNASGLFAPFNPGVTCP